MGSCVARSQQVILSTCFIRRVVTNNALPCCQVHGFIAFLVAHHGCQVLVSLPSLLPFLDVRFLGSLPSLLPFLADIVCHCLPCCPSLLPGSLFHCLPCCPSLLSTLLKKKVDKLSCLSKLQDEKVQGPPLTRPAPTPKTIL